MSTKILTQVQILINHLEIAQKAGVFNLMQSHTICTAIFEFQKEVLIVNTSKKLETITEIVDEDD